MIGKCKKIKLLKNRDLKLWMQCYIIIFAFVMLLYNSLNPPLAWGEFDDYTLPVASILNDHNFSITESDLQYYKILFPEQTTIEEVYSLSGYTTHDGKGELTWYFPTYAILSLPMILLLYFLGLPASYGFLYANILFVILLLVFVYKYLNISEDKKFILILMLSINPVLFYFPWMMAETVIFSLLGMSIVFWHNNWYKRAALFLSIAGTLNPTIMVIGFFMIFDFLVNVLKNNKDKNILRILKKKAGDIISYGCCFVPGILPMIYNYYHTGHINLTASYASFTHGRETTFQRFRSYLLDLNYGFLPYYGLILLLTLFLIIPAIRKKRWRFISMITGFVSNVYLYSIMTHINCGGSGISRYNSWCGVVLILSIILYYDEIFSSCIIKKFIKSAISINAIWILYIICSFGPYAASNTWNMGFKPVAKIVLDYCPKLYNPLGSTFYSSINNTLGGYDYKTPVIYTDDNGYVRKILATDNDANYLNETYAAFDDAGTKWFSKQLNNLTISESYISVPPKYQIIKSAVYNVGTDISFTKDMYTAGDYINSGMYEPESWGSWSKDRISLSMTFDNISFSQIYGHIICGVYNQTQLVQIHVNGKLVFNDIVRQNEGVDFSFNNPGGLCEICIELPYVKETAPSDGRVLGLSIGHIIFDDKAREI